MKVDILLPIYNSPTETRACIESIITSTPKDNYNLYLLDDCSPNPEIKDILDFYAGRFNNIIAVKNKENKGFPGNVNSGLRITENDVIILNSDTIVTDGWLMGLYNASVSQPKVAAVGPLSNYGIISSVPTIYQQINDSIDINRINKIIRNSSKMYIEAPVLIGFCMYLTRKALNEIGLLDEATFKKGYGEEIDWCLRAREMGYKILISTDTYVYHKGGTSFGQEKIELQKRHEEIINKRYKNYSREVEDFELNHPLLELRRKMSKEIGVSILFRTRYNLRRKKLLLKRIMSFSKISVNSKKM
ncbi:glycosyltransferase [Bacillus sp. HMF5848]|uniref:glycosyltransferase family 2 protein n=1 Tax=Bacillus sp. HMF5848 TaxID=2495421 RepID=UPI000F78F70D|nr:glycosyltransferase [Bacillus sp. HMF5848]RSK28858.1 glycosyltransferase [Bacillus sp. HMF5848]